MNYLYEPLKEPVRLYIKQCPHCHIKYFGKTSAKNVEKYTGSGTKWKRHIKKHNVDPIHLWHSDWYYDKSITRFAIKFSKINKIVESKDWANLVEEDGIDGISSQGATDENYKRLNSGTHPFCDPKFNQKTNDKRQTTKKKNRTHNFLGGELQRKRVRDGTHHFLDGELQRTTMKKIVAEGRHPMQQGNIIVVNEVGETFFIPKEEYEHRSDLVHPNSLEGKKRLGKSIEPTEKQIAYREKLKSGHHLEMRKEANRKKVICPYCNKEGGIAAMHRWHFDNCKNKEFHQDWIIA